MSLRIPRLRPTSPDPASAPPRPPRQPRATTIPLLRCFPSQDGEGTPGAAGTEAGQRRRRGPYSKAFRMFRRSMKSVFLAGLTESDSIILVRRSFSLAT